MLKYLLTLGLLSTHLFSAAAGATETPREKAEREAAENKMSRIRELLKNRDISIRFYGRILDQFDHPVEDANVVLHVTRFSPSVEELFGEIQEVRMKSDSQGRFAASQIKGRSLYLKKIEKAGYEFLRQQTPITAYRYAGEGQTFVADQANPIVFRMRKTGSPVFLLQDQYLDFQVRVNESGKPIGHDFIQRRRLKDIAKASNSAVAPDCDLQVMAMFNTNNVTWTVVLSPCNTNGGIIVSDQLLYEAPETSYYPKYTFTPEDRKPVKAKYVYLRSRDPAIYTRFEIQYINANKEFFRLEGKSVTNPYGERNLEGAINLPYVVTKKLTDEVETAFRQNKRPSQPDLPKLVKEAEAKVEKDKGKQ